MAELQKDPMTRGDFLGFGVMGAIMGAILTIPPVAFVLSPIIKTDVLGESDVGSGWVEVASVADVGVEEPSHFKVEFPLQQTYGERAIQKEFPNSGKSTMKYESAERHLALVEGPDQAAGQAGVERRHNREA